MGLMRRRFKAGCSAPAEVLFPARVGFYSGAARFRFGSVVECLTDGVGSALTSDS